MNLCLGVIILGGIVMLYGAITVYENEGKAFMSGCFIAAAGTLMLMLVGG